MIGQWKLPEYWVWQRMKQRCFDKNTDDFKHYGARGITVCERWMMFENFYADMGPRPKGMTVERADNAIGYEPGNCRWATREDQMRNTRANRMITHNGETLCEADWSLRTGISAALIQYRLEHGWSVEKTLTTTPRRVGNYTRGDQRRRASSSI